MTSPAKTNSAIMIWMIGFSIVFYEDKDRKSFVAVVIDLISR